MQSDWIGQYFSQYLEILNRKNTFVSHKINWPFIQNYFKSGHAPKPSKGTQDKFRQVWALLGMSEHTQTKVTDATFP